MSKDTFNYHKFDMLKREFWRRITDTLYQCVKHNNWFDIHEEPCWECQDECEE